MEWPQRELTSMRFTAEHIQQWREEGFVVIERFFDEQEYEPVVQDFEALYSDAGKGDGVGSALQLKPDDARSSRALQFKNIHVLPYDASRAINLLSLHVELIGFARALLGVSDVRLYQSHTWAKYTGEADYDQDFHCDYGNHTLLVPADDPARRTVDFVIYLTDVTKEHGALRYVTKPDVLAALGRPVISPNEKEQEALRKRERAVVVPAGSLVAHGIDTIHRGSNLTAPNGRRFSLTVGYKAAGSDQIGFHVWQATPNRPWHLIFDHATPEQLACLGIPKPGDSFWTERTLELTQSRWPNWNMAEYVAACRGSGVSGKG
jgi:ectoine hydroxylase-related dioxygenase (phytanoyl-CoA dioxygenase family)